MKAKRKTILCGDCYHPYDARLKKCPLCNHEEDKEEDWKEILETLRKTIKHLHGRMDETERRLSNLESR